MISYHIAAAASLGPHQGLTPEERQTLSEHLPRGAVRRISENGIQMSALLTRLELRTDEPLVMATRFAEGRSLEAFLQSFPTPSPTRFQTSVHPSGVQQGRVAMASPITQFLPMSGHETLGLHACRSALFTQSESVVIVGGEERATWLADLGVASSVGYCFALRLCRQPPVSPLGTVSWSYSDGAGTTQQPDLRRLFDSIHERSSCTLACADIGSVRIEWS